MHARVDTVYSPTVEMNRKYNRAYTVVDNALDVINTEYIRCSLKIFFKMQDQQSLLMFHGIDSIG